MKLSPIIVKTRCSQTLWISSLVTFLSSNWYSSLLLFCSSSQAGIIPFRKRQNASINSLFTLYNEKKWDGTRYTIWLLNCPCQKIGHMESLVVNCAKSVETCLNCQTQWSLCCKRSNPSSHVFPCVIPKTPSYPPICTPLLLLSIA